MKYSIFFSCCVALGLLLSCKSTSDSVDDQESSQFSPATFEISYYNGGGMLPMSENVLISSNESHWKYFRYGKEILVNWDTSPEELKELYGFLKKHNYSKIVSKSEGEVFDRGGLRVTIKNGEETIEIDNSGSNFIEEKWSADYKAIKQHLDDFVNTKVYHKKLNISMASSSTILSLQEKYEISVFVDGEKGMDSESREVSASPTFKVFEGVNKVDIRAFYRDSIGTYGNKVSFQQDMIFLEATKATRSLFLDFVDGKFTVKFRD